MRLSEKIFNLLIKPLHWGWDARLPHSENRLTMVVNFCTLLAMFPIVANGFFIFSIGSLLGYWYLVPFSLSLLCLTFNALNKTTMARITLVTNTNLIGLFAGLFFGKEFNGYRTFFIALMFSVILFGRNKKSLMIPAIGISLLGLPLIDFLHVSRTIPLLPVPERLLEHYLFSLLFDSFAISFVFVLGMAIDKWHAEKYERGLESWNDLLEKKVAERTEELLHAKDAAEQANLLKSQFLANISHELRIPMQGILGFTQLAQERLHSWRNSGKDAEEIVRNLEKDVAQIHTSANRLHLFLSRLFEIVSSVPSLNQLRPTQFMIDRAIEESILNLQKEAAPAGIQIQFERSGIMVKADRALFQNAVHNVLENAIRYSDENSAVQIQIDPQSPVVLKIINQGMGVPEQEAELVFEPFTQSSRTDRSTGGTGLGLYRARRSMRAQGGDVALDSSNPQRTTFKIILPRETVDLLN